MSFEFHPPSKSLEPYVKGYLQADYRGASKTEVHTLFPNGFSGIFFNFGNTGKLIIEQAYKTPPVSIFGQIDQHFTAISYPGFYSIGALLNPTVLSWLLQVDMSEFTNKAFDGRLIDIYFKTLHEQMEEATSFKKKIQLFEHYFINAMIGKKQKNLIADHALAILQQEFIAVQELAKKLQVSQRHLETQFKLAVGLPLKTYSLIVRFKKMEHQLKTMQSTHWPKMEFSHEYYDQNHFIKEFKRFTGHTPSGYLMEDFEMGRSYLIR